MKRTLIGYARVSSKSQNLARQLNKLHEIGCAKIFTDKRSGKNTHRSGLRNMLKFINSTNEIVVVAIDRLGRNMNDIQRIMRRIKAKGATINILNLPSMRGVNNPTLKKLLDDLIIDLYSYTAETERKEIRARQAQGIAIAKANGKYKGRGLKFTRDNRDLRAAFNDYFNRKKNGLSAIQIARLHGMSRSTLYKKLRKYKPQKYEEQFKLIKG